MTITREEAIARLSRYQSPTPSEWREEEEHRLQAKQKVGFSIHEELLSKLHLQ